MDMTPERARVASAMNRAHKLTDHRWQRLTPDEMVRLLLAGADKNGYLDCANELRLALLDAPDEL